MNERVQSGLKTNLTNPMCLGGRQGILGTPQGSPQTNLFEMVNDFDIIQKYDSFLKSCEVFIIINEAVFVKREKEKRQYLSNEVCKHQLH